MSGTLPTRSDRADVAVKLDIGAGCVAGRDGWTTVDLLPGADIVGDLRELGFADVAEARLIHVLEHFARAETIPVLRRVRGWLRRGARIAVEVPDMAAVMRRGVSVATWAQDIYGAQNHPGEFHLAGFTARTLEAAVLAAGFRDATVAEIVSDHPMRRGMPCLTLEAVA